MKAIPQNLDKLFSIRDLYKLHSTNAKYIFKSVCSVQIQF